MDKTLAALTFFTRIPLWRLRTIPAEAYERVVDLWPLAGWVTGGLSAGVFILTASILPPLAASALAIGSRLLLTAGLHEDGLADFFDGFGGGGTDRRRILDIMKDSRTGSYGVIAIALYLILLTSLLATFPPMLGAAVIFGADAWSKACSAFVINFLPYARSAATAKNRLVYRRMTPPSTILCIILGLIPLSPLIILAGARIIPGVLAPIAIVAILILYIRRRLGGYTGDCCGAIFLMAELAMILTLSATLLYI